MAETVTERPKIILPKAVSAPTHLVPRSAIWMGLPKLGKTTKIVELPNHLIIDAERGSNFVSCNRIQPPENTGPVGVFRWIKDIAQQIKDEGRPYDHIVIETISFLDELSEWVGTYNYMKSPQGIKFNRNKDGTMKQFGSEGYESIHTQGEGYGYRWSREAMLDLFDATRDLGKICTHYTGHIADKYVASKSDAATQVRVIELAVTGKLKYIIPRDIDALGYLYQKNGQIWVSFKGSEEKIGGMRGAAHMKGYEGILDWDEIFLTNKNKNT